ncbi:MAG: 1-phosphofructokinase family hexose kinase [Proteobacteria bacterium]|nr:1-phosphofructokinase family hexose kinase [Pseudomonadota bacterium]
MRILTVTLNPAIDVSASVPEIVPQHKLRCHDLRRDPGGGGINVARVLHGLGADVHALFAAGGPLGALLTRQMTAEGVGHTAVPISGDTREDFTVTSAADGLQYRFVLPGPVLASQEFETVIAAVGSSGAEFVVASGSLPPGAPPDAYRRLRAALPADCFFALDTSGAALAASLGPGVSLIKPSRRELAELLGEPLPDRGACVAAARRLVAAGGAESVAVSLGEDGALFVGRDFACDARAPQVVPKSTVGAGDSFLAALVFAIANRAAPDVALRHAVAAGTAALLAPGTALAHAADIARLESGVIVGPAD